MKYLPKKHTESFIVFPSTFSLRVTLLSLQNFIAQLEKKDPNLVIKEFAYSEMRLVVRTENKKTLQSVNDNEKDTIHQEEEVLVRLDNQVTIHSLLLNLKAIKTWLKSRQQHEQVMISATDNYLRFKLIKQKKQQHKHIKVIETKQQEKLLILDGSNVLTKGYFATKKTLLQTSDGIHTNGVLSLVKTLFRLLKQYHPTHIAVCWDSGRDKTFRKKLYPSYKANRSETEPELKQQYEIAQLLLKKMNVAQFFDEEYEADDLIGTLVQKWKAQKVDMPCYFVSNDKDLHQLLHDNATQVISQNGDDMNFTLRHFERKYGVTTDQWIDVKALLGEPGDNIPGVKGVGDKAAIPLIQNYGSVELLYEQLESLQDNHFKRYYSYLNDRKEEAFLSKQLATIVTNVASLASVKWEAMKLNIDKQAMIQAFQYLEFNSLLSQIQNGAYRVS